MNIPGVHPFSSLRQSIRTLLQGGRGFHLPEDAFKSSHPVPICFCSFVGLFVSRTVVDRIGYPDPEWFIYGDDIDYTLNICEEGFSFQFDPSVRFTHDCATLIGTSKAYQPTWRVYYHYRNLIRIYRRIAGWLFWPTLMGKLVQWLGLVRYYPVAERGCYLRLLRQGVQDGLADRRGRTLEEVKSLCGE